MTNIADIAKGTITFLGGYFFALITQHIVGPLIETMLGLNTGGLTTGIMAIIWLGLVIIWTITLVIAPIALIVQGLQSKETQLTGIMGITFGALWGLFSLGITITAWDKIIILGSFLDITLLTVLFWIGALAMVISNIIAIPAYIIIESKQ